MSDQKSIVPQKGAAGQEVGGIKGAASQGVGGVKNAAGGVPVEGEGHLSKPEEVNWYAIRAFKRKVMKIREDFEKVGFKTYIAMRRVTEAVDGRIIHKDEQIIPQLLFVCCTERDLKVYKDLHKNDFMIYSHKVTDESGFTHPAAAPIPEAQMKAFIFITSTGDGKDIEYYADIMPHFEEGERVQVTDGIYKGATGFVKRIKRDRKLLVAIEGVAVVAISNIPISYLKKI